MHMQMGNVSLTLENERIRVEGEQFCFQTADIPLVRMKNGDQYVFSDFRTRHCQVYQSGTFEGFKVDYRDHPALNLALRTYYLFDRTTQRLHLRLLVLTEQEGLAEILWPMPFELEDGYHVLPLRQGLLCPVDYAEKIDIPFHGQFCSAAAYLSMLGSVNGAGNGVLMVNETPWDDRYYLEKGKLGFAHLPSLGKMAYRRDLTYVFYDKADYNDFAHTYRQFMKEKGLLCTLTQKRVQLPQIDKLIQSSFVHMGICTYVQPDSRFYDADNPEKNNSLTPFKQRLEEMRHYHEMGMSRLYLHLDGWGRAYDNGHPDVMPINEKAGGAEAFKALVDGLHDMGDLFGVHDQYRDYYHHAPSYDPAFSRQDVDGHIYSHDFWAGGKQDYLCASLAKDYVVRNFTALKQAGIHLDGAYLDVFTCNELDECANIDHRMTRKECRDARQACFLYLVSRQIMPSSEEVNEWAMPSLVFCHYAPYELQMHEQYPEALINIPLFNLVFHECVIIPWMMERPKDDYMLYALLNGGAPYLRRDGAYPNIDGSFDAGVLSLEEQLERCKIVSHFHEKVAGQPMVSHRLLDPKGRRQESIFGNGWRVEIDLDTNQYMIEKIKE